MVFDNKIHMDAVGTVNTKKTHFEGVKTIMTGITYCN